MKWVKLGPRFLAPLTVGDRRAGWSSVLAAARRGWVAFLGRRDSAWLRGMRRGVVNGVVGLRQ